MRTVRAIVLLALGQALVACNDFGTSYAPFAPSLVVPPRPPQPVVVRVFTDPASGFASSDVRDVQDQIVRFNTANELIWAADGARFPGYPAREDQVRGPGENDWFQVRFGSKNGERRLYLGWSDDFCHCPGYTPSVIDVEIVDGRVVFTATDVPVPGI
jgi:hypothetical protein